MKYLKSIAITEQEERSIKYLYDFYKGHMLDVRKWYVNHIEKIIKKLDKCRSVKVERYWK